MTYSIGNKLLSRGLIVIVFIILIIIASQVVVHLFKNTSEKIVVEFNELEALQELKLSLNMLMVSTSKYAVCEDEHDKSNFKTMISRAEEKLNTCKVVVTESHERDLLYELEHVIVIVDSLAYEMYQLNPQNDQSTIVLLLSNINREVNDGIDGIDSLLRETKVEIIEYESINNIVIKHSTYTFLALGFTLLMILIFGGLRFIKSLTKPIKELVSTTNKISKGDRSAKVEINTKDEFHILARSFNRMLDTLDETTVSKDYFNNILENMFDALIVTDNNLMIRSLNKAALNLLEYSESELIGKNIMILFERINNPIEQYSKKELINYSAQIDSKTHLRSKSGSVIPASISCSILKTRKNEIDGLIVVGHDLTKQHAIEKKLEHARKERQIIINDAQEEERIRIATDLHDGLGQMLTAISYSVQDLPSDENSKTENNAEALIEIQRQIDAAIQETKNLAHNLIPIVLKDFGLIVAIENLVRKANEMYETNFQFNAYDFDERIDAKLEKVLYRICQESLNNIVKHAHAKHATYQMFWQNCAIVLVIEDDGLGFDPDALEKNEKHTGIGLISMKERVLAFNGDIIIYSEVGNGTEIIIEIPCRKI
jgi:PAS domain S-box-containing protein